MLRQTLEELDRYGEVETVAQTWRLAVAFGFVPLLTGTLLITVIAICVAIVLQPSGVFPRPCTSMA